MQKLIIVGKIGSAYGVLGWNKIFSYTEKQYNIFQYQPWFIRKKNIWVKTTVEFKKINNNKIIAKIENINDRESAKKLTNSMIGIQSKQLPKLTHFEYYWKDIINCIVYDTNNKNIGFVSDILRSKLNDILVIKKESSYCNKDILIPFIKKIFIQRVNLKEKKIYIHARYF